MNVLIIEPPLNSMLEKAASALASYKRLEKLGFKHLFTCEVPFGVQGFNYIKYVISKIKTNYDTVYFGTNWDRSSDEYRIIHDIVDTYHFKIIDDCTKGHVNYDDNR